jgi:hypothetical protein
VYRVTWLGYTPVKRIRVGAAFEIKKLKIIRKKLEIR